MSEETGPPEVPQTDNPPPEEVPAGREGPPVSEPQDESGEEHRGDNPSLESFSEEEIVARALEIIAHRLRVGELTLDRLLGKVKETVSEPDPSEGSRGSHEVQGSERAEATPQPEPTSRRRMVRSWRDDTELMRRLQILDRRLRTPEPREEEHAPEEIVEEEEEEETHEEDVLDHIPDYPDAVAMQQQRQPEREREEEQTRSHRKKRMIIGAALGALAVGALAYFASRGWHLGGLPHHGGGGGNIPPGHGGTGTPPPTNGPPRPPVADTITLPPYNHQTGAGTIWHATWLEGRHNGVDYSQADLAKLMPRILDYNGDPNPYDVPIGYEAQFPSAQVMNQWLHS